jgi:acyl-CoA thioesterase FadM
VESGARFASPVRYGDQVRILSTVVEVGARTFRVAHEVSVGTTACASGFEVRAWVAVPDAPGGKLRSRPLPEEVARLLQGGSSPGMP